MKCLVRINLSNHIAIIFVTNNIPFVKDEMLRTMRCKTISCDSKRENLAGNIKSINPLPYNLPMTMRISLIKYNPWRK